MLNNALRLMEALHPLQVTIETVGRFRVSPCHVSYNFLSSCLFTADR